MADGERGRRDRGGVRQQAVDEIDRCEVKLLTVGTVFASALTAHVENAFALADDLLAEESSPKTWIQSGIGSWFQCFDTQKTLLRKLCEFACPPPGTEAQDGCTGSRVGPDVHFCLDAFAEATDPMATDIPPAARGSVTVARKSPLVPHIRLTVSDVKGTARVMVGLAGLRVTPDPLPAGQARAATLRWTVGSVTRQMMVLAIRRGPPVA